MPMLLVLKQNTTLFGWSRTDDKVLLVPLEESAPFYQRLKPRKLQRDKWVLVTIYHEFWSLQHHINLWVFVQQGQEHPPAQCAWKWSSLHSIRRRGRATYRNPHSDAMNERTAWARWLAGMLADFWQASHRLCWNLLWDPLQICRSWIVSAKYFNLKIWSISAQTACFTGLFRTNSRVSAGGTFSLELCPSLEELETTLTREHPIIWGVTRRNMLSCSVRMARLESHHLHKLHIWHAWELEGLRSYRALSGEKGPSDLFSTKMEVS